MHMENPPWHQIRFKLNPTTLDVEEVLRNKHDVLQIECPTQIHLNRHRQHHNQMHDDDRVADETKLLVELFEDHGDQARQHGEVEAQDQEAGNFPLGPVQTFHRDWIAGDLGHQVLPEQLRDIDIVGQNQLVFVPGFVE